MGGAQAALARLIRVDRRLLQLITDSPVEGCDGKPSPALGRQEGAADVDLRSISLCSQELRLLLAYKHGGKDEVGV